MSLRYRAVDSGYLLQQTFVKFEQSVHDTFHDAKLLTLHVTTDQEQHTLGDVFDRCAQYFLVIFICKQSLGQFEEWREPTLAELLAAPYIGMHMSSDQEPPSTEPGSNIDSALDQAQESQLQALGISDEQLFNTK
jgi:hypothetical protein